MPELEQVVLDYVSSTIADSAADGVTSVTRLAGGENNTIYKVAYQDPQGEARQVAVRIGSPGEAGRLRAEREATVLRKVGGAAGPRLYDFCREVPGLRRPLMCIEFVEGVQLDLAEASPDDLERLGGLVQWLHVQPVDDLGECIPPGMGLAAYVEERWRDHLASRLGAIRHQLTHQLQERLRAAVVVAADAVEELRGLVSLAPGDDLVLLHGDISGANLLWVPDPLLIDWEYARLGDPADEVAYLFTQNALIESQRDAFLRGYSGGLAPMQERDLMKRIRCWEPITALGSILWWLDAWSRTEKADVAREADPSLPRDPDYYLEQAVRRLDQFQPH